jgi:hypothetical protein
MYRLIFLFLLSGLLIGPALPAQRIVFDNDLPRTTVAGDTVDAHDGRIIQFGDTYYWYGTAYGTTNGFTTANHYVVYRSPDMRSWTKEGRLLPDQPEGVYYRPHVIFNERTGKYVLWYNWYPQLWDGQFGVATSDSPAGPFTIQNDNVEMFRSDVGLGDFGLFVDDDGTAYISYNTIQNHQVSIEKLSDDYLSSTRENGGIIGEHMEAGSQFKRNGKYYLLTDYTCCFCNYGSGARVYISDDPLSGYVLTGNINRYPGRHAPLLTDGVGRGTSYEVINSTDSLSNSLILQHPRPRQMDRLSVHLFTGNRPENCGNVSNPRVHPPIGEPDFTLEYWDYDHWEAIETEAPVRNNRALSQVVHLDFEPVESDRLRIRPKGGYPFTEMYANELVASYGGDDNVMQNSRAYLAGAGIPQSPIVPAQQNYVMALETENGTEYLWMGDMWGSASDNVKGHDYPYWSAPLRFTESGRIMPLEWTGRIELD